MHPRSTPWPAGPELLARLAHGFRTSGPAARAGGALWVVDPAEARAVLGNRDGHFVEHSDFFASSLGQLGPRSLQVDIGRGARELLGRVAQRRRAELPALIERELAPGGPPTHWPDAANLVLLHHLGEALLAPTAPPELHDLVREMVERSVLASAHGRGGGWARARYRARAMRLLTVAAAERRSGTGEPADLLELVARLAPAEATDRQLAEIHVGFIMSVTGSLAFLLAWSVYLLGLHPEEPCRRPAWVVREALRLWPVAWLFDRRVATGHRLGEREFRPGDTVTVCSWLTHRHPDHWDDPEAYRPARWEAPPPTPAYLPFGWGPYTCAAATLSTELVEDLLGHLLDGYRITVEPLGSEAQLGSALAPPPFLLELRARNG
ncbi:cytochrome P450 [Kitasatospora sp. NPDC006697]|uniref:cytochrome P450 n=1 Tax=Kitasatospora sp. NPDC006697 TaxID=3364020 RepID=UPI0036B0F174